MQTSTTKSNVLEWPRFNRLARPPSLPLAPIHLSTSMLSSRVLIIFILPGPRRDASVSSSLRFEGKDGFGFWKSLRNLQCLPKSSAVVSVSSDVHVGKRKSLSPRVTISSSRAHWLTWQTWPSFSSFTWFCCSFSPLCNLFCLFFNEF